MKKETVFVVDAPQIKFGPGATREVGSDLREFGVRRAMVVVDPQLRQAEVLSSALKSLHDERVEAAVFDDVRVEPNDLSLQRAARFALEGKFDGYLAIGGGSTIDTAKAANLYATYPADFYDYVNAPIGKGLPVPGPLKPIVAIPTTAGTGSETSGVAVFGVSDLHVKTAISDRALRPRLGILDPDNTRTQPRMVAACAGIDVLIPALESLIVIPYQERPAPETPRLRPGYQGSNPISHIWGSRAVQISSLYLVRAVEDPNDDEARGQMLLASSFGGIGYSSAGVCLPHAMSYPVSGMVRNYVAEGYPAGSPLIPHGMSVALVAPAAFRFMAEANPEMFLYAAELMGVETRESKPESAGNLVAEALINLIRCVGLPNGLRAVGYSTDALDALVEGTLAQERLTRLSPRPVTSDQLRQVLSDSMTLW